MADRTCPECGKVYKTTYLQAHRRQKHGVYGGESGLRRNDPRYAHKRKPSTVREVQQADSKALVKVERPEAVPDGQIRVLPNFQVVTDGKRLGVLQWVIDNG